MNEIREFLGRRITATAEASTSTRSTTTRWKHSPIICKAGLPVSTPVFDGASVVGSRPCGSWRPAVSGQTVLRDGRTGQAFAGRSRSGTCTC